MTAPFTQQEKEARASERAALLERIEEEVAATAAMTGLDALPEAVRQAMLTVPRHLFVPEQARADAYANHPLPIGAGQTISQPYIVALMTALCGAGPGKRVLEIGTGCGYQAAVLAETGAEVWSVEFVESLAESAKARLAALGYDGVRLRCGDGRDGWPEAAPFDAILVTAAAARLPQAYKRQLAPGGRIVIPIGPTSRPAQAFFGGQELRVIEKDAGGRLQERTALPVAFVPLVRG